MERRFRILETLILKSGLGPMLRYILVGCGAIAPKHIREIQHTGLLVAVCDTDPAKLEEYMHTYHVQAVLLLMS